MDRTEIYNKQGGCEDMDWLELSQDGVQWQYLMNTGTKLCVQYVAENYFTLLATILTRTPLFRGVSEISNSLSLRCRYGLPHDIQQTAE
jgi:hypothetical protein